MYPKCGVKAARSANSLYPACTIIRALGRESDFISEIGVSVCRAALTALSRGPLGIHVSALAR